MTTGFQRGAFQFGAFQIDPARKEVRWPGTTVRDKRKKKDDGPDLRLIRDLTRQAEEAAAKLRAAQAEREKIDQVAVDEARRIAEEAAQRGVEELKKSSGVEVRALLAPTPIVIPAVIEQPRAVEQEISAVAEEEELVLLMLLAQ